MNPEMTYQAALDNFIAQFKLPREGFTDPIPFTDAFGFSTSKDRNQNGYVFSSSYKIYIQNERFNTSDALKPIYVVVSYGEKVDGNIRLHPTSVPRKSSWPIDFVSTDEFYYSPASNKFQYREKDITAIELLRMAEKLHLRPTKKVRGFPLRLQLIVQRTISREFFKFLYNVCIYLLYFVSGTWTIRSIWSIYVDENSVRNKGEINPDSFAAQKINIFGYEASAWSVVSYCFIHLTAYALWYFYSNQQIGFLSAVFRNNFLTIVYVIPSLVFYERIIPLILEWYIKYAGTMFRTFSIGNVRLRF